MNVSFIDICIIIFLWEVLGFIEPHIVPALKKLSAKIKELLN